MRKFIWVLQLSTTYQPDQFPNITYETVFFHQPNFQVKFPFFPASNLYLITLSK